jgi:hypothetical protein
MMTLDELQRAHINLTIVREAYDHADKRLADTLDTKKAFEQKAFTLFGGYLTISLALFGAGGAVASSPSLKYLLTPFWGTGAVLVIGTIFFLLALTDKQYGALASHPDMWLNKGTIDGPDSVLPTMLSYITFYMAERIDVSVAMNRKKADWIRWGIYAGIASPLAFGLFFLTFRHAP